MIPPVVIRLVADVDDFIRGWDRAADAALRAAARIRAAAAATPNGPTGGGNNSQYRDMDAELQRLIRTLRATTDQMREFGNGTRRAGDDVDEFGRRTRRAGDDVDEFGRRVREAGNGLGGFGGGAGGAATMLSRLPPILAAIVVALPIVGGAALAGGAAILGIGAAAGVAAMGSTGLGQAFGRLGDTTQGLRRHLDSVFRTGLSEEMAKLGRAVSTLEPEFKDIARAIVDIVKESTQWLRSSEGMEKLRTMLQGVRSLLQNMSPGVKALVQLFVEFGASAAPMMGRIGAAISEVFIKLRDVFREAQKNGDLAKAFATGAAAIRAFGGVLAWVVGAIIWMAARAAELNAVLGTMGAAGKAGADALAAGFATMQAAVQGSIDTVVAIVTELPGAIVGVLASLPAEMTRIGGSIVGGLIAGLRASVESLVAAATAIAKAALVAIKKTLGIASPSKVFAEEVGAQIPAGIAAGIAGSGGLITDAMRRLPGMGGNVSVGLSAGRAPAIGAARTGGAQTITLSVGAGADSAMGTAIAKLARTGQLRITASAITAGGGR